MEDLTALKTALVLTAGRHGHKIAIGASPKEGEFAVTLGKTRGGLICMVRQPAPGEGGRSTLNHPRGDLVDGRLSPGTCRWMEEWAESLTAVRRHAARLASLGLGPDAYDPRCFRANSLIVRIMEARGFDFGMELAGLGVTWMTDPRGHVTQMKHDLFVETGVITRYLDDVHLEDVCLALDRGMVVIKDADDGNTVSLEIHMEDSIPDTAVHSLAGRPLAHLVKMSGNAAEGMMIQTAEMGADGALMLRTNRISMPLSQADIDLSPN